MAIKKTKEFGERLKRVLKASPIQTVTQLSKVIGTSQSAIYSWIKGDTFPSDAYLPVLYDALPRLKDKKTTVDPGPTLVYSKEEVRDRAKSFLKALGKALADPKVAVAVWGVLSTARALGLTLDDVVDQITP